MEILSAISSFVYQTSLCFGYLFTVFLFIVFLLYLGFNLGSQQGQTNIVLIGGGCMMAMLFTYLAVWPIFYVPHEPSWKTFWFIYLLELILGVIAYFISKVKRISRIYFIYIFVSLIVSSWVAKAFEYMIINGGYLIRIVTNMFIIKQLILSSLIVNLFLLLVGLVYTLLYFISPLLLCIYINNWIQKRREKKSNQQQVVV